jgi:hypothetical protein
MAAQDETVINCEELLRGCYEARNLPKDYSPERIAPDFGFNVLNKMGLLYTPIVDKHYLGSGGPRPSWPDGKAFAVCLTHDVDRVSLYSISESSRIRWSQIKKNPSILKKIEHLLRLGFDCFKYMGEKDPLHCYELWLRAESEINARSTFFFWPGIRSINEPHETDCRYELRDTLIFCDHKCTVAEMIKQIDKESFEIGLHASWYSFNNANEMKRQKEALANVLEHDIVSVRQHYLHYDIRVTPKIHEEAGFQYDSTVGFNDNIGFRFGSCYPWYLYDLIHEKEMSVLEIPLIIQDTAMLSPVKGLRLDEETAFEYIKLLIGAVEKVGGVLTLLWHPNYILNLSWWNLYLSTLQYLKEKDAWFGTMKEIGKCWEDMKGVKKRG